jgi:hypothetical protein
VLAFKGEIIKEMCNVGNQFKENELAYLAFTIKIERPIRDKLAWIMDKKLKKYCVTREYGIEGTRKKIDFAIIKNNAPKVLVQFKAISILPQLTVDRTFNLMKDDFKKMRQFMRSFKKETKPELYFIQLVNIPHKKLDEEYKCHIAPSHYKGINNYFNNSADVKELKKQEVAKWETRLTRERYCFKSGSIDAGGFYDNHMQIIFWIIWR